MWLSPGLSPWLSPKESGSTKDKAKRKPKSSSLPMMPSSVLMSASDGEIIWSLCSRFGSHSMKWECAIVRGLYKAQEKKLIDSSYNELKGKTKERCFT